MTTWLFSFDNTLIFKMVTYDWLCKSVEERKETYQVELWKVRLASHNGQDPYCTVLYVSNRESNLEVKESDH